MKLNKNIVPNGGWFYIQPETEFRIDAQTFDQLIDRVMIHRDYKEIDPCCRKLVEFEVEVQIRERLREIS